MSSSQASSETAIGTQRSVDMKLEVIVIPVADVDRAKRFYEGASTCFAVAPGWLGRAWSTSTAFATQPDTWS
jgi:hypothetical protein